MTTKIKPKSKSESKKSRHTGRPLPDRPAHASASGHKTVRYELAKPENDGVEMFPLGTMVLDNATQLKGMLTHLHIDLGRSRHYRFQPYGLNPETGEPVKGMWIEPNRIKPLSGQFHIPMTLEPVLPFELLDTEVEDIGTGFAGLATALVLHQTGCVHVSIQPRGKLSKSGNAIESHDFDVIRLKKTGQPAPSPLPSPAKPSVGATEHESFSIHS